MASEIQQETSRFMSRVIKPLKEKKKPYHGWSSCHVGSYLLNSDSRWARAVKNEAERLEAGEVSRGQVLGEAEGSH